VKCRPGGEKKDEQGRKGSQFNRPREQTASTKRLVGTGSSGNTLSDSHELKQLRSGGYLPGKREVEVLVWLGFLSRLLLLLPLLVPALLLPLLNLPLQQFHPSLFSFSFGWTSCDLGIRVCIQQMTHVDVMMDIS
jgi:hypothetical protein